MRFYSSSSPGRTGASPMRTAVFSHDLATPMVRWLQMLSNHSGVEGVPSFSERANNFLNEALTKFGVADALSVKKVERTTNHDVKAVENVLQDKLRSDNKISEVLEFVHFACISEDINNLAHALILKSALNLVVLPTMNSTIRAL